MSNLNTHISRMMAATGIMIVLATLPSTAFSQDQLDESTCEFTRQLQDPDVNLIFTAEINAAKAAARSPYGETATNSVPFTDRNGNSFEIDKFSFNCLTCHDGINAKIHEIRHKEFGQEQNASFEEVRGNHPIGMHYGSYAYASNSFKKLFEIDEDMVLVDGKVGCLTCHNPQNPEKRHIARTNLCMGCHIK